MLSWLSPNGRAILEHIVVIVLIEIGLGVVSWVGHLALEPSLVRTLFLGADEWAMLGAALWFIRNLAVHLWNNRERLNLDVFVSA